MNRPTSDADLVGQLRALGITTGDALMVHANESEPFDALRSPVDIEDVGVLAEVFRTYPGVAVNDHPADRFAAIGPAAFFKALRRTAQAVHHTDEGLLAFGYFREPQHVLLGVADCRRRCTERQPTARELRADGLHRSASE